MSSPYDIHRFADLHERLPRFAEITARLVEALGLEKSGGRGPKAEAASDRVIRDYVRRRVLSPTLKGPDSDERGYYGFRHLVEFLAARVLINDGWPLDKIAERHRGATTADLLSLIPGQPEENEALALARSFRRGAAPVAGFGELASALVRPARRESLGPAEAPRAPRYADPAGVAARRRAELPMLMRAITGAATPPDLSRRIALDFGERLTVLIDQGWLERIDLDEADAIGRAVAAALIDYPNLLRGKDAK